MVAKELLDYFTEFNVLRAVGVEDGIDRMNSLVTMAILLVCVLIVGVKQYVLSPIACFASTGLKTDNFMDYVTTYCWSHGTIPLLENETQSFPTRATQWDDLDKTRRISYYQWVPFVLCLQAVLFHLPRLLWSVVCRNMAGTDMENLISLADQASRAEGANRQKMIVTISGSLDLILQDRRREPSSWFGLVLFKVSHRIANCCGGRGGGDSDLVGGGGDDNSSPASPVARFGSVIRLQYLIVKIIYIANVVGQIILVQYFLGFLHFNFGWIVLQNLLSGHDWRHTNWFPRVTYCNAKDIAVFGDSNQRHVVQCCLPLNMLNEKIYVFLWFWFVLLLFLSFYSFCSWFINIFYRPNQDAFIDKLIRMLYSANKLSDQTLQQQQLPSLNTKNDYVMWRMFTRKYLHSDGVFLLQMIKTNAGDLLVSEIVRQLWITYRDKKYLNEDLAAAAVNGHNMTVRLTNLPQSIFTSSTPEKEKLAPTAPPPPPPSAGVGLDSTGFYPPLPNKLGFEAFETERV